VPTLNCAIPVLILSAALIWPLEHRPCHVEWDQQNEWRLEKFHKTLKLLWSKSAAFDHMHNRKILWERCPRIIEEAGLDLLVQYQVVLCCMWNNPRHFTSSTYRRVDLFSGRSSRTGGSVVWEGSPGRFVWDTESLTPRKMSNVNSKEYKATLLWFLVIFSTPVFFQCYHLPMLYQIITVLSMCVLTPPLCVGCIYSVSLLLRCTPLHVHPSLSSHCHLLSTPEWMVW